MSITRPSTRDRRCANGAGVDTAPTQTEAPGRALPPPAPPLKRAPDTYTAPGTTHSSAPPIFQAVPPSEFKALQTLGVKLESIGGAVDTGWIKVPANRAAPGQESLTLPVVVARALGPLPPSGQRPPPMVLLTGGPGPSSVQLITLAGAGGVWAGVRQARDIICIGERGAQASTPGLEFTELAERNRLKLFSGGRVHPVSAGEQRALTRQYFERLQREGHAPSDYNEYEMAADVHDTLRALGHTQYVLYGVSFGSRFAQQVAKRFPGEVKGLILDSPVGPFSNLFQDVFRAVSNSLQALFEDSRSQYPALERDFTEVCERLDRQPREVEIAHPETGEKFKYTVTGQDVFSQLVNVIGTPLLPMLPRLVAQLKAGDLSSLIQKLSDTFSLAADPGAALYLSIAHPMAQEARIEDIRSTPGLHPLVRKYLPPMLETQVSAAREWKVRDVRDLWPEAYQPLRQPGAQVFLSYAKYDANTLSSNAGAIAGYLPPGARVYRDEANTGHVTIGPRLGQEGLEFLAHPERPPGTLSSPPPPLQWR